MIMLLEALPDPGSYPAVGWLVVTIAGLSVSVNHILKFVDRFKEQPPPASTYTTKAYCERVHNDESRRINELRVALVDAERARTEQRGEISSDIAGLREEVRNDIQRLHDRMDRLPSQLVALLKNTGALE